MSGTQRLWHVWPGRNRPATSDEEQRFVADLASIVDPEPVRREDITTLVNALRCAVTVDELHQLVPGVQLGRLLGAWHHVDQIRQSSFDAWRHIVTSPTSDALHQHTATVSRTAPGVGRQLERLHTLRAPAQLRDAIASLDTRISRLHDESRALELVMVSTTDSETAAALGRRLYDPYHACLWSNPEHLPLRVGTIMPLNLAEMLGERN